jgi:hypothetical protein
MTDALLGGYDEVRRLSREDHRAITLWALFVGVRRLGMIDGRPRGSDHRRLVGSVRHLVGELRRRT